LHNQQLAAQEEKQESMGRPLKEFLQIGADAQRNKQNMSCFVLSSSYFFSSLFLYFYSLFFLSSLFFSSFPFASLTLFPHQVLIAYYLPSLNKLLPTVIDNALFDFSVECCNDDAITIMTMTTRAFSKLGMTVNVDVVECTLGLSLL